MGGWSEAHLCYTGGRRSAFPMDAERMAVTVFAPCDANAGSDPQASLWQSTGQRVTIAGVSVPIESSTIGAPQVSYRASVTLRGYTYVFTLQGASNMQAQQDMPAFLTFMRSFQYVS